MTEFKMNLSRFVRAVLLCVVTILAAGMTLSARSIIEDVEVTSDEINIKVNPPIVYDVSVPRKGQKMIIEFESTIYPLESREYQGSGEYLKSIKIVQTSKESNIVKATIELKKSLPKNSYVVADRPTGLRIAFGKKTAAVQSAPVVEAPKDEAAGSEEDKGAEPADAKPSKNGNMVALNAGLRPLARKVTLRVNDVPLTRILDVILQQTGVSFLTTGDLGAKRFSAFLEDVTLKDALRALLEVNGLGYEQIGESNTFTIKTLDKTKMRLVTKVFKLKYTQLYSPTGGGSSSSLSGGGASLGGKSSGGSSAGGASGTASFLEVIRNSLSDQGKLLVYPETNSLIISDIPENFTTVEDLIDTLDMPIPQVMIEVYFVETNANTTKNLGLTYGATDGTMGTFQGNSKMVAFPFSINGSNTLPANYDFVANPPPTTFSASNFYGGVSFGIISMQQLLVTLKAVESTGEGQYLSRPKILTLNNKTAEIEITADTVVEFETKQFTGSGYLGEQSKNPKRKTTGITLRVTPQVNEGGQITLSLEPLISRPQTSTFFPNDSVVDTHTRSLKTSVRVTDGKTVLIGGLLSNDDSKTDRRVPFLGRIPIIGWFFSSLNRTAEKRELLIFITPRVVVNN